MLISKIVSGGQTGVDRGALEAAYDLGFPYGGIIPKGRKAEDGQVPLKFDMEVAYHADYLFRTRMNVSHSDATLIISRYNLNPKPTETRTSLSGGTKRTQEFCTQYRKPCLVLFTKDFNAAHNWLLKTARDLRKEGLVLNVAGPRESKNKGIQQATYDFIKELLEREKVSTDVVDLNAPVSPVTDVVEEYHVCGMNGDVKQVSQKEDE